jgi:hypothetical protein
VFVPLLKNHFSQVDLHGGTDLCSNILDPQKGLLQFAQGAAKQPHGLKLNANLAQSAPMSFFSICVIATISLLVAKRKHTRVAQKNFFF